MSNQEMQFADPDWKPSQKLDTKTDTQEQETFIPEPVNADSRERWNATPPPPPRQDMYTGLPPYAGAAPQQPVRGQYRQGPYRRGGRGIWFWVILAFIIISLMGGGFGSAFNRFGDGSRFSSPGFNSQQSSIIEKPQIFRVSGPPTVVINGDGGTITVQTSSDANTVTVQDTRNPGPFDNANDIQVNYSQSPDGNTINASVPGGGSGSVDFTVTVPQDATLQLNTTSGDISINGVSGQVTLQTDTGNVNATNDTFSGTSTITTNSGDVGLSQTKLGSGTTINTQDGTINLTVPANSAFHLNASTNSGSVDASDFPSVKVQPNNQGGTQATGNVGNASQGRGATVTLSTNSGDINVHKGP